MEHESGQPTTPSTPTPAPPPPGPGATREIPAYQAPGTDPIPPPTQTFSEGPPRSPGEGGPPATGGGRGRGKLIALIVAGVVLLGGIAFAAVKIIGALTGTGDVLAKMVPADNQVYVTAYLDPGASQKLHLKSLAGKFPALQGKDLTKTLDQMLEDALRPTGLSYARDVKPWLGSQLAVTAQISDAGPTIEVLIASKDDTLAGQTLTRLEGVSENAGLDWASQDYKGVEIRVGTGQGGSGGSPFGDSVAYAVVDHTAVIASGLGAVEQIVDADQGSGSNLGDDPTFTATQDTLPDSVLGMAFVNTGALLDKYLPQLKSSLGQSGGTGPCGGNLSSSFDSLRVFRGVGLAVSAESDGMLLDIGVSTDRSKGPSPSPGSEQGSVADHRNIALSFTPANAYGLLGLAGADRIAGTTLQQLEDCAADSLSELDQLGVRSLIANLGGDIGLEVQPGTTSTPGGAIFAQAKDGDQMQAQLDTVMDRLAEGAPVRSQDYKGTTIKSIQVPDLQQMGWEPAWAVVDGVGIVATSPQAVQNAIDAHGGSDVTTADRFEQAAQHVDLENNVIAYVDVGSALDAVRATMPPDDRPDFDKGAENVRPLKAVILSSTSSDDAVEEQWFFLIQ
ncbi:MAG TPA: DUF3352 domain-containing protein [Actinomycetota bacterium]